MKTIFPQIQFHCKKYVKNFKALVVVFLIACSASAQTIMLTSPETMWLDANKCNQEGPQGAWISYLIINNTSSLIEDVYATFSGFTGTYASYFVKPVDDVRFFPCIGVGDSIPLYYYVDFSALCTLGKPYTGYTANYSLTVTSSNGTVVRDGVLNADELITANAAGIALSSELSSTELYVGQVFTQTVIYQFGNNSNLFFQPNGEHLFPEASLRLIKDSCSATTGNVTGILGKKDRLTFPDADVPGAGGTITIVYWWQVLEVGTSSELHPWAAAKSGQPYKYHGFSDTVSVPEATKALVISKSVNPQVLATPTSDAGYGPGIVEWTVTLANPTANAIVAIEIMDILPPCMEISMPIAPTSEITLANSCCVPDIGETGTVKWNGLTRSNKAIWEYKVLAYSSMDLVFRTDVSGCASPGEYENYALSVLGRDTIGPDTATLIIGCLHDPTQANAGSDQSICPSTSSVSLDANSPIYGTGSWSVVSGPSLLLSQFSDVSDPQATFTPAGGSGVYVLRWTIALLPCTSSSDDVSVTVLETVDYGTITSGDEIFYDIADPSNITFSDLPSGGAGTFTYQWYFNDDHADCPTGGSTEGWTLIDGATGSSYDPPDGLTHCRTYAVIVDASGDPDCGPGMWAAGCRKITVHHNPVAVNDYDLGNEPETVVYLHVDPNDYDINNDLNEESVDLDPVEPGIQTTYVVPGEGTWTTETDAYAIFTPESGYTYDPTPKTYTIMDFEGGTSNAALLFVDYIPVAANDTSKDNVLATAVTQNVILNDDSGDIPVLSSIQIVGTLAPGDPLIVSGEGTWSVNLGTGEITFTPESGFTGDPTPITYTVDDNDGNTSNQAAVVVLYLHPDVTPTITAEPNIMHGEQFYDIIVQVTELLGTPTLGLITVIIPKDIRWIFDGAYEQNAAFINGKPVENSLWTYEDTDPSYHVFKRTNAITGGNYSKFGFKAIWNAGYTVGQYTITSQILSGSGSETRIDNNVDAERLDYFIN